MSGLIRLGKAILAFFAALFTASAAKELSDKTPKDEAKRQTDVSALQEELAAAKKAKTAAETAKTKALDAQAAAESDCTNALEANSRAEAAKGVAETALRRIGMKLGAHKPDAETVEKRSTEVWEFCTHAALAFGIRAGDTSAIQKATQEYAQMKMVQGGTPSDKDAFLTRLREEHQRLSTQLANIEKGEEVPAIYAGLQARLDTATGDLEAQRVQNEQLAEERRTEKQRFEEDVRSAERSSAEAITELNRAFSVEMAKLQDRVIKARALLETMQLPDDERSKSMLTVIQQYELEIENLKGELAGKVFDDLQELAADPHRPPGTVFARLAQFDAERKASQSVAPPPGDGQRDSQAEIEAAIADELLKRQSSPPAPQHVRRPTETYGTRPDGDAEAEAAVAAEVAAAASLLAPPAPHPTPGVGDQDGGAHGSDDEEPGDIESVPTLVGGRSQPGANGNGAPPPDFDEDGKTKVRRPIFDAEKGVITCICGAKVKAKKNGWTKHQKLCDEARSTDVVDGLGSTSG